MRDMYKNRAFVDIGRKTGEKVEILTLSTLYN